MRRAGTPTRRSGPPHWAEAPAFAEPLTCTEVCTDAGEVAAGAAVGEVGIAGVATGAVTAGDGEEPGVAVDGAASVARSTFRACSIEPFAVLDRDCSPDCAAAASAPLA